MANLVFAFVSWASDKVGQRSRSDKNQRGRDFVKFYEGVCKCSNSEATENEQIDERLQMLRKLISDLYPRDSPCRELTPRVAASSWRTTVRRTALFTWSTESCSRSRCTTSQRSWCTTYITSVHCWRHSKLPIWRPCSKVRVVILKTTHQPVPLAKIGDFVVLAEDLMACSPVWNFLLLGIASGAITSVFRRTQLDIFLIVQVCFSGEGPFTLFAPDDEAFMKLPAGTLDALLKDKTKLKGSFFPSSLIQSWKEKSTTRTVRLWQLCILCHSCTFLPHRSWHVLCQWSAQDPEDRPG